MGEISQLTTPSSKKPRHIDISIQRYTAALLYLAVSIPGFTAQSMSQRISILDDKGKKRGVDGRTMGDRLTGWASKSTI